MICTAHAGSQVQVYGQQSAGVWVSDAQTTKRGGGKRRRVPGLPPTGVSCSVTSPGTLILFPLFACASDLGRTVGPREPSSRECLSHVLRPALCMRVSAYSPPRNRFHTQAAGDSRHWPPDVKHFQDDLWPDCVAGKRALERRRHSTPLLLSSKSPCVT